MLLHFYFSLEKAKRFECSKSKLNFNELCLIVKITKNSDDWLNPNWHELWKQEKCSTLAPPRGIFYKTQWAWQGVKLTRLMSIFTSKKVWKFLIKIQLPKIWFKKDKRWKVPCLMPIRVKQISKWPADVPGLTLKNLKPVLRPLDTYL